jgi:hypothetical protein
MPKRSRIRNQAWGAAYAAEDKLIVPLKGNALIPGKGRPANGVHQRKYSRPEMIPDLFA